MSKSIPSKFLWAVEMVVKGNATKGRVMRPFEGEGSYEVALNIVQDTVNENWVLASRVVWFMFGIEQWQGVIKKWDDSGSTERVDYHTIEHEIGVRLVTLDHYLQTRFLGKWRNGLMDDFVAILKWLHEHHGDKAHFSSWVKQMLKRRTGLERENDPYADPLLYSLLCKHFDVSE